MNNGLLVIDKPSGYTSRDVVNIVSRFFNTRKVGYAGTLDPIATGVLVVAVNDGLKLLEYLSEEDKEYIATVKLGITTDTLDVSGNILEKNDNYFVDQSKLKSVIESFKGKYLQEVPLYSSVRVNGKRLYKYAREKEEVVLPKREVEIFDIELLEVNHDEFTFKAKVSKGTYIRSLIRDIGEKINLLCTMKNLRRTKQGIFSLEDSISIQDIENNRFKFISSKNLLNNYPKVQADSEMEKKIINGAILDNIYGHDTLIFENDKELLAIYGIYQKDNSKIKPIKVFKKRD